MVLTSIWQNIEKVKTPAANYDIIPYMLTKTIISPDDNITEEDVTDIEQTRAEHARGEAIPANAINWD